MLFVAPARALATPITSPSDPLGILCDRAHLRHHHGHSSRRAILLRTATAELLVETLFHYRDAGRYLLHGFVIMPEHLHVLLTPASDQTIERCAQCIKGGLSHLLHAQFPVWQPGFHEHRVRDTEDFHNQLTYIASNPQRRRLTGHPYVHTGFTERLDPTPAALTASRVRQQ